MINVEAHASRCRMSSVIIIKNYNMGRGEHGEGVRWAGKNTRDAGGRKGAGWRSKGKRADGRSDRRSGRTSPQRPTAAYHARTRNSNSVGGTREGKDAAGGVLRALPYAEHRPPIREPHEGGRRAHEKPSSEKNASHDRGGMNGSSTAGGPRASHDYPGMDECGERTTRPRTRGATAAGATWHAEGAGSPHSSCGRPSRSNYAGGARATDDDPGVDASEGRRANTRDRRVTTM